MKLRILLTFLLLRGSSALADPFPVSGPFPVVANPPSTVVSPEVHTPSTATTTPQPTAQGDKPIVTLVTAPSWCEACRWIDFAIKEYGEERLPFTIHRREPSQNESVPRFYWGSADKRWQHVGYEPIETFIRRWEYSNSLNQSSAPAEAAPTPQHEIDRALSLLPKPAVGFYAPGCGDGRDVISAARKWGCKATGVEINHERAELAKRNVEAAGLSHLVTIIEGDAREVEVDADVGFAYLYPELLVELTPKLTSLKAFASYKHPVPGLSMLNYQGIYVWSKPQLQPAQQIRRGAVWGGQTYYAPLCNSPNCRMCASIRRQLGM